MKFLQHFESHQEFSNKHMTISQFENEVFKSNIDVSSVMSNYNLINCLKFTQSEIETIKKIIGDIFGQSYLYNSFGDSYCLRFSIVGFKIDIYKKDDSWYPLCIHGISACICDDLGGLEFYLKKVSSIVMLINNITKE
jgi:hypothetical protein